jgi:hypothetical protein
MMSVGLDVHAFALSQAVLIMPPQSPSLVTEQLPQLLQLWLSVKLANQVSELPEVYPAGQA